MTPAPRKEGLEEIQPYLKHKKGCEFEMSDTCDCGFEDAVKALAPLLARAEMAKRLDQILGMVQSWNGCNGPLPVDLVNSIREERAAWDSIKKEPSK